MPATKGTRKPQLLEQKPDVPTTPTAAFDRIYFCGRRKLTYLGDPYEPGDRMPDSVGVKMPRLDTKVRQGLIHVQYVPRPDDGTPPPIPAAPDGDRLSRELAANVADPPTSCEHDPTSWAIVEHDGQQLELCGECGARRPVGSTEEPVLTGIGGDPE